MAWRCSGETNESLIENMWKNGLITDARVKEAFLKVCNYEMGISTGIEG